MECSPISYRLARSLVCAKLVCCSQKNEMKSVGPPRKYFPTRPVVEK